MPETRERPRLRTRVARLGLGAVGLGVGVVAVLLLREATLSTHQPIPHESRVEIVVSARSRNAETHQTLAEMVEAQLVACRLEVTSDLVGEVEALGGDRFAAVMTPALDETNRRQFRGCVEDWVIDGLLVDVVEMNQTGVPPAEDD